MIYKPALEEARDATCGLQLLMEEAQSLRPCVAQEEEEDSNRISVSHHTELPQQKDAPNK